MEDASLAYLPRNVAPEILSITPLPIGVGLQQMAQLQIDPNVESAGLDPALFGAAAQVPPRRLFQRGARSFQWQAEDRNGDTLEYAVYYRGLNDADVSAVEGQAAGKLLHDRWSNAGRWPVHHQNHCD